MELSKFVKHWKPLSRRKVSILRGNNRLLMKIGRDAGNHGLRFDFSSKNCFIKMIAASLSNGLYEMLERKYYSALDIVFPIIGAYIDRLTWFLNVGNMTGV